MLTVRYLYKIVISFSFSAGYNNVEVAEFLLENGADVNAQDKGGLIPLHNASSYGVSLFSYTRITCLANCGENPYIMRCTMK